MRETLRIAGIALAVLLASALVANAQQGDKKTSDDDKAKYIVKKNIFEPYKPPPKKYVPPKRTPKVTKPKPKPKPVYEQLYITGIWYDNKTKGYLALVETADGEKKVTVGAGDKLSRYTVKVVMCDRVGFESKETDPKTKKSVTETMEMRVGDAFDGDQIGTSSSSRWKPRTPSKTTAKKPDKPLPKLDSKKKMSILERLKAKRKAQMEKRKKEGK